MGAKNVKGKMTSLPMTAEWRSSKRRSRAGGVVRHGKRVPAGSRILQPQPGHGGGQGPMPVTRASNRAGRVGRR
jgi:hypothetical protein